MINVLFFSATLIDSTCLFFSMNCQKLLREKKNNNRRRPMNKYEITRNETKPVESGELLVVRGAGGGGQEWKFRKIKVLEKVPDEFLMKAIFIRTSSPHDACQENQNKIFKSLKLGELRSLIGR